MILTSVRPKPKNAPSGVVICSKLRAKEGKLVACTVPASWLVGVRLRSDKHAEPVDHFFEQLKVCTYCRSKVELEMVLPDRLFFFVSQKLVDANFPPPKRKLTRLIFKHLKMDFLSGD
jgi:hypothetical protein